MQVDTVDDQFGTLRITANADQSVFTVDGDTIPTGTLTRDGDATRTDTPIGTRDPARLALTLDGATVRIVPAPGRWSRRSYRIHIHSASATWLFTAATPHEHRLVRGARYEGGNEIGMFTRADDNVVVQWSQEIHFAGMTATVAEATALDCTLGYLLAAGFGTGAQLLLPAIISGMVNGLMPS